MRRREFITLLGEARLIAFRNGIAGLGWAEGHGLFDDWQGARPVQADRTRGDADWL
jgi:hypothetical protein